MTEQSWMNLLLFVHLVAISWGVAGSTLDNVFVNLEREPWMSLLGIKRGPWLTGQVFPWLSRLITAGVALAGLSGVAMVYLAGGGELNLKILTVKLILFAILFVNGMYLTLRLEPEMEHVTPAGSGTREMEAFQGVMGRVRTHSLISLVGWYVIVALSIFIR
jgi:hypothetical protein